MGTFSIRSHRVAIGQMKLAQNLLSGTEEVIESEYFYGTYSLSQFPPAFAVFSNFMPWLILGSVCGLESKRLLTLILCKVLEYIIAKMNGL